MLREEGCQVGDRAQAAQRAWGVSSSETSKSPPGVLLWGSLPAQSCWSRGDPRGPCQPQLWMGRISSAFR